MTGPDETNNVDSWGPEDNDVLGAGTRAGVAKGFALLLMGTATGSVVPVISKAVMEEMPAIHFSVLWMAFALFYTTLLMLRQGFRPSIRRIASEWRLVLPCGLAAVVWVYFAFQGLALLDPTVATFILNSRIVWAVLVGFLILRERYAPLEIVGILAVASGVIVVFWEERRIGDVSGAVFMLLSAVGYVVTSFFAKHLVRRAGVLAALVSRFLFPLLVFIPLSLVRGDFIASMSRDALLLMFFGAFVGPFLTFNLLYSALKYLHLGVQTVFLSVSVVLTGILSYFTLGTIPTTTSLIGGGILVSGMIALGLGTLGKSSPAKNDPS